MTKLALVEPRFLFSKQIGLHPFERGLYKSYRLANIWALRAIPIYAQKQTAIANSPGGALCHLPKEMVLRSWLVGNPGGCLGSKINKQSEPGQRWQPCFSVALCRSPPSSPPFCFLLVLVLSSRSPKISGSC